MMYTYYIGKAQTKDRKAVGICIQSKIKLDNTLETNIVNYVRDNMDTQYSVNNSLPCCNRISLVDGANTRRTFYICFILTWNQNYTKVLSTDLISLVEQ